MKSKYQNPQGRKQDTQPLKEVIEELLDQYRLRGKFAEQKAVNAWNEVMGPFIAERTVNKFIKNQTLHVELSSAALKQELSMSKAKVLQLINEKVGAEVVKDIRFL